MSDYEDPSWDEKIKEAKEKGWFVTHHDDDLIRFEQVIEGYENRIMEYYKKYEQLFRYDPRSPVKVIYEEPLKKYEARLGTAPVEDSFIEVKPSVELKAENSAKKDEND